MLKGAGAVEVSSTKAVDDPIASTMKNFVEDTYKESELVRQRVWNSIDGVGRHSLILD